MSGSLVFSQSKIDGKVYDISKQLPRESCHEGKEGNTKNDALREKEKGAILELSKLKVGIKRYDNLTQR